MKWIGMKKIDCEKLRVRLLDWSVGFRCNSRFSVCLMAHEFREREIPQPIAKVNRLWIHW